MADEKPEIKTPAKGPGLMTLIKAVAFVSVIVLLQIAAASMIIPSAEETTKIAEDLATAETHLEDDASSEDSAADEDDPLLAQGKMIEVSLDSHHVLNYNPKSGSRVNLDFNLFATVLEDEADEFHDLFLANQQRIAEQIRVLIRGAEMTDLTDPALDLLKRKVLEKVNRTLGKPLLHEVIFSKFSFDVR